MKKKNILIVDDKESIINLLKHMLANENYIISEALNGEEALKVVYDNCPDLILLDIMMPGIDGFEVCRRLKQDEKTKMIPIVIITALSEKKYRLRAIRMGADDLLFEPVDKVELLVRIKSLLRIKSYYDELVKSYKELTKKKEEIESLEKNRDALRHMVIHDLRSPLTVLCGNLEQLSIKKEIPFEAQRKKIETCIEKGWEINQMVQNLLDTHKSEEGKIGTNRKEVDFAGLINEILKQYKTLADAKRISISFTKSANINHQQLDPVLMTRVILNLLTNAIRHTPEGGRIDFALDFLSEDKSLRLSVKDSGEGLAPEYHQKIFEKYEQVSLKNSGSRSGSTGLGLTFCKMVVEAHGGRIWVESGKNGGGADFIFTIPV